MDAKLRGSSTHRQSINRRYALLLTAIEKQRKEQQLHQLLKVLLTALVIRSRTQDQKQRQVCNGKSTVHNYSPYRNVTAGCHDTCQVSGNSETYEVPLDLSIKSANSTRSMRHSNSDKLSSTPLLSSAGVVRNKVDIVRDSNQVARTAVHNLRSRQSPLLSSCNQLSRSKSSSSFAQRHSLQLQHSGNVSKQNVQPFFAQRQLRQIQQPGNGNNQHVQPYFAQRQLRQFQQPANNNKQSAQRQLRQIQHSNNGHNQNAQPSFAQRHIRPLQQPNNGNKQNAQPSFAQRQLRQIQQPDTGNLQNAQPSPLLLSSNKKFVGNVSKNKLFVPIKYKTKLSNISSSNAHKWVPLPVKKRSLKSNSWHSVNNLKEHFNAMSAVSISSSSQRPLRFPWVSSCNPLNKIFLQESSVAAASSPSNPTDEAEAQDAGKKSLSLFFIICCFKYLFMDKFCCYSKSKC